MEKNRLWYIVKGYNFGDVDNSVCTAFGSVYCAVANHASHAISKVNAFLKKYPWEEPNSPVKGTSSMHEEAFLCPVGNQSAYDAQNDDVYVYDDNILLYNSEFERRVWRAAIRDVRANPQRPVVSFDDAVTQFLQHPLRFQDLPETAICDMKIGAVEKSRDNVQDELNRRFSAPSYQSFVRCVQEENRAMDNEFIDELPEYDRKVVRADIELAELKSFEFMGVGHQTMCLANGDAVFDKAFPEVQDTFQAARERSNPVDDKVVEHDGF